MKDFVRMLFSEHNSELQIGLFDGWHFLYLGIIFGGTLLLSLLFRNRRIADKEKLLRVFAYLTVGLYLADFMIMPLSDSYSGISTYKLPYNICTIMAVMVPFVQFNRKFLPVRKAVVTLSIASSLMWMCYPGTALGGQPPFSYIIFQTFMYHGLLFCWGVLNYTTGSVKLSWRTIWQEFVGILCILVWAFFGNTVYDGGHNWFFIETSIFPFLSDEIMPLMVVGSVFGVCIVIHAVYYTIAKLIRKQDNIPA